MKRSCLTSVALAILLASLLCPTHPLHASEIEANDASENDWDVRIGLPLWASGAEGTVAVRGREAEVDEDFSDIIDNLDFTAALNIEARKAGWLLFANGLYLKTTVEAEPRGLLAGALSDVELEQVLIAGDLGVGYAVVDTDPFRLEVFGGARLTYLEAELAVNLLAAQRTFSRSKFWADPIVGLQGQYQWADRFALYAKGDVGGFGVSSDLTWQAEAGLDFGLSEHTYLRLCYRFLSVDFEDDGFAYDMETSGPQLEFGFRF